MPERHWPLAGCANLRDLGGYPTMDGGTTRWGRIYRADSLHALPAASQQALLDAGLHTVIDLRTVDERIGEPSVFAAHPAVQYRPRPFYGADSPTTLPLPTDLVALYRRDVDRYGPQIAAILTSLLEPTTLPVVVHCAVGKDRTGIIAALLLGNAGVDPTMIVEDYAWSAVHLAATFAAIRRQATPEDLQIYGFSLDCTPTIMQDLLDHWEHRYGGIVGYLRAIGLSEDQRTALRSLLVPD